MILSIDCGTQSLRALLFSLQGELIAKEQVFYEPYFSNFAGWAEQDADVYWKSLCKATRRLKRKNPKAYKEIMGVGVTSLRNTMVNLDKNGEILRPSLHWLDQRSAKNVFKPKFPLNVIFQTIGVKETLKKMETKGHCNWIRQNQPDIWRKTHKYVQITGFLYYKLTGKFIDSVASQIGYVPFDHKKQKWANPKDILEFSSKLYPVEKAKLPDLVFPGELIGEISPEAYVATGIEAGTKVIAAGSDKACETLGMGVLDTSMVSLSFGTTATVQTTTSKYFEPVTFYPAYPSVIPHHWNPEIEIFRGFWMISWFKNEFGFEEVQRAAEKNIPPEEEMNALLHKAPPGSMGLIVQPYWSPGLGEKNAKGAIIGFGDVHKKEHVYRAVIEGLAYGLLDGMQRLEKKGNLNFERIAVSGGAAQSDEICQITADVFNKPLVRGKTYETSGLGAAIITALGVKAFPNLEKAVESMVNYVDTFQPIQENVEIYKALFEEVYLNMFKNLEPLYKKIRSITNYPD